MGCVTMTYDPPLKRYLMCVLDAVTTFGRMNTFVLESEHITGPWKLVTFMKEFGRQGYFPNFPSKFIGADGRTLWLCYAANFGVRRPADAAWQPLRDVPPRGHAPLARRSAAASKPAAHRRQRGRKSGGDGQFCLPGLSGPRGSRRLRGRLPCGKGL